MGSHDKRCQRDNIPAHLIRRGRKFRRACCCLGFLMLLTLLMLSYVAHKVHEMSDLLSPESGKIFAIDEETLCNDICVSLCTSSSSSSDCDTSECINSCDSHLESQRMMNNQDSSDSSDSSDISDISDSSDEEEDDSRTRIVNQKKFQRGFRGRRFGGML